jgi:WD40 repeat protein
VSVFALDLMDRGSLLLLRGENRHAEVWSVDGEATWLRDLALEPDECIAGAAATGDRVLVARPDRLRIVSARDGRTTRELPRAVDPNGSPAGLAQLSSSGKLVALEARGGIELRDAGTGELARSLPLPNPGIEGAGSWRFELLGDEFLALRWDGPRVTCEWGIRVADGKEGRLAEALLPDGEFLTRAGSGLGTFPIQTFAGDRIRELKPAPWQHWGWFYSSVSPSGTRLVLAVHDAPGAIEVFSTKTGARIREVRIGGPFNDTAVSADGDRVADLLEDGTVQVWDLPR